MSRIKPLELETVISGILRAGVLVSIGLVLLGVLMWVAAGHTGYPPEVYPTSLPQVFAGVLAAKPLAVVQAGLLVLILTPVLQVGASVAMFAQERDRVFAVLAACVLVLLVCGTFYGMGGR